MNHSIEAIRDIYCVGRNYAKHAEELGNDIPDEPLLFSKPLSSLAFADGNELTFPGSKGEVHYELELVLKIGKDVEEGDLLDDIVTEMALGIDLTLRDIQAQLKKKGHPWLRAKGFRNATILSEFFPFPGENELKQIPFSLVKQGETVQKGYSEQMIFSCSKLLEECHREFGLKKGDLLFTGTPEGVGPIQNKEEFQMYFADELKGQFLVKIES
ncbi:fumarylacetoacetate hydrolase family protein [Bacillus sp. JCM 19046]|nr:fumarylacetoacetate hydrolase family protein [Bacillus sp. JCM 19045]GAF18616.1 fumarylacetoacetate hydrolase family protein [Bacillus sp. JCM 19046]